MVCHTRALAQNSVKMRHAAIVFEKAKSGQQVFAVEWGVSEREKGEQSSGEERRGQRVIDRRF